MTMREKFEEFWRREMNIEVMDLHRTEYPMTAPKDQQYMCDETNLAWITWQAAYAAGMTRAAETNITHLAGTIQIQERTEGPEPPLTGAVSPH